MTVTRQTRYGGVYEGGPWAAFDVEDEDALPMEAFGGDPIAVEWWLGGPSVLVGVGDSPEDAIEHLRYLKSDLSAAGRYEVGDRVVVARPSPDQWFHDGVGLVAAKTRVPFDGRCCYRGTVTLGWEYEVEVVFDDDARLHVPEAFLRQAEDQDQEVRSPEG